MVRKTKKRYEALLNGLGECANEEDFIMGGKMRRGKYGTMQRKYDPIAFEVGYKEYVRNSEIP